MKTVLRTIINIKRLAICCLFLIGGQIIAQEYTLEQEAYYIGFPFTEGIYNSFEEFKNNAPSIQQKLQQRSSSIYYLNAKDSLVKLNPDSVWGYSVGGKVYLSNEEKFWRFINIGQLIQFTAVVTNTYGRYDTYGFYNEVETRNLQQSFLDMNDGKIKALEYKNMKPYIDSEPSLANYIKNNKKAKYKELVLVLKAYNRLNPLYFPTNE